MSEVKLREGNWPEGCHSWSVPRAGCVAAAWARRVPCVGSQRVSGSRLCPGEPGTDGDDGDRAALLSCFLPVREILGIPWKMETLCKTGAAEAMALKIVLPQNTWLSWVAVWASCCCCWPLTSAPFGFGFLPEIHLSSGLR